MAPNMGFYDACYAFTVFCEDLITAALDTDPSDVGPDASVDLIIASDFSAADDVVINGQSLALGQLGGSDAGAPVTAAGGASPAIEAVDEADGSTIDAATKDSVLVGRVKRDDAIPNGIWIWAVCDNLRRGSSLNAVLVAEAMFNDFAWAN